MRKTTGAFVAKAEHLVATEFMVEKIKAAMTTSGLDRLLEIERRTMKD